MSPKMIEALFGCWRWKDTEGTVLLIGQVSYLEL